MSNIQLSADQTAPWAPGCETVTTAAKAIEWLEANAWLQASVRRHHDPNRPFASIGADVVSVGMLKGSKYRNTPIRVRWPLPDNGWTLAYRILEEGTGNVVHRGEAAGRKEWWVMPADVQLLTDQMAAARGRNLRAEMADGTARYTTAI